jgi:hypothetical protein
MCYGICRNENSEGKCTTKGKGCPVSDEQEELDEPIEN